MQQPSDYFEKAKVKGSKDKSQRSKVVGRQTLNTNR